MFQLLIALFLGFACPQHNTNTPSGTTDPKVSTFDIIGEGGHIPPKKPNT